MRVDEYFSFTAINVDKIRRASYLHFTKYEYERLANINLSVWLHLLESHGKPCCCLTLRDKGVLRFFSGLHSRLVVPGLIAAAGSTLCGALRCKGSMGDVCRGMALLQQQVNCLRHTRHDLHSVRGQLDGCWSACLNSERRSSPAPCL